MSTVKSEMKMGEPLQLFQPFNLVVFLSFFSPIILAVSITSLSFMFQNFKGLIYLQAHIFFGLGHNSDSMSLSI
jgi:hypothetical protein